MTNIADQAANFVSQASTKVLVPPVTTGTGGNSPAYVSKAVGGSRKSKSSKKGGKSRKNKKGGKSRKNKKGGKGRKSRKSKK